MSKNQEKKSSKLTSENFRKFIGIFRFVIPYRTTFTIGFIFLLFSSVTLLAFPFLAGKLLDAASGKSTWILKSVNHIALTLIGILFIQGIFSFLRIYLFSLVSERAMADVRYTLYQNLMHLPIAFYDKSRVGELMSRITSDVTLLQTAFTTTLAEFVRQVLTLLVGTIVIFVITPRLSGFMFATFPVIVIISILFGRYIRKLSRKTQDELAETNVIVEETLQAIRIVKAFTNELFEIHRYKGSLKKLVKVALKTAAYRGVFASFIIFGLFGGIVAVMWYGATLVQSGNISVGDLMMFVLYTAFIGGSIGGLSNLYGEVQRVFGATQRVLEIVNEKTETSLTGSEDDINFHQPVLFDHVSFAYPSRREVKVLKNVSFTIETGSKVALVGHSGSGKSTITQLLLRYYAPDEGKIMLGNTTIGEFDLKNYRKKIAIVPQEVMLFGGTIKENIAYGKPGASHEEIEWASEKSHSLDFINSFPDGFDTIVGERGIRLSGGQKQRIAIARALLKDPALLILDEATSSLDSESEMLIQQALETLMENRTSIIIAHRLSTIRKVDKIFLLSEGSIIESGTHEELSMKQDGVYQSLLRMQFQEI